MDWKFISTIFLLFWNDGQLTGIDSEIKLEFVGNNSESLRSTEQKGKESCESSVLLNF